MCVALLAGCGSGATEKVATAPQAEVAPQGKVASEDAGPVYEDVITRFDQIEAEYVVALKKIETATLDSPFDRGFLEELQTRTDDLLKEVSTADLKDKFSFRTLKLEATVRQVNEVLTQITRLDVMGQTLFETLVVTKPFVELIAVKDQLDALPVTADPAIEERRSLIDAALRMSASVESRLAEVVALSDADLASVINRNSLGVGDFNWKSLASAATEYAVRNAAGSEQNRRLLLDAQLKLRKHNEAASEDRPIFITVQEDIAQFEENLSYGSHVILFPTKSLKLAAKIAAADDARESEDPGRQMLESVLSSAELSSSPDCIVDMTSLSDVLIKSGQSAGEADRENTSDAQQKKILPFLAYASFQHIGTQLMRAADKPARHSSSVSRSNGSGDLPSQRIENSYAFVGILDRPVEPELLAPANSESAEDDDGSEPTMDPGRLTLRVSAIIQFAGYAPSGSVLLEKPASLYMASPVFAPAPWRQIHIYTKNDVRTDSMLAITNAPGTDRFLESWPEETARPLVLPSPTYPERIPDTRYMHFVFDNSTERRNTESAFVEDFAPQHVYSKGAMDKVIQQYIQSAGPLDPNATPTQHRRLAKIFEAGPHRDLLVFVGTVINSEGDRLTEMIKCLINLKRLDNVPATVDNAFSVMLQNCPLWYSIPSNEGFRMVHVQNANRFVSRIIVGLNLDASRKSDHEALASVREMIVSHVPTAYRPPDPPEPQSPRERKASIKRVDRIDLGAIAKAKVDALLSGSLSKFYELEAAEEAARENADALRSGDASRLYDLMIRDSSFALAYNFKTTDTLIDRGYKPSESEIAHWQANHAAWQQNVAAIERQWQEDQKSVTELWSSRKARLNSLIDAVENNRINIRREIESETKRIDIHYIKSGKRLDEFEVDTQERRYLSDPYETFPITFLQELDAGAASYIELER
jgi:hypothetical protein